MLVSLSSNKLLDLSCMCVFYLSIYIFNEVNNPVCHKDNGYSYIRSQWTVNRFCVKKRGEKSTGSKEI